MTKILVTSSAPKIKMSTAISNSANYNNEANWDGTTSTFPGGNVTTVGTNGGPSYYGTYDQSGNLREFFIDSYFPYARIRGGFYADGAQNISINTTGTIGSTYTDDNSRGFRICTLSNPINLPNFVSVGDIGNINWGVINNVAVGQVNYIYQIGKYLITNSEYAEFLNAIASTDTYNLYNISMATNRCGIIRNGTSGNYTYSIRSTYHYKPVTLVSWDEGARYCNWLHNNKPTGLQNNSTTENGAYTLDSSMIDSASPGKPAVYKNADAKYWIPSESEWIKAAFYTPDKNGTGPGYWTYATQSDTAPTPVTANSNGDGIPPIPRPGPKVRI